ncbi:MAG: relaxase/mobilization nuclease domain-containing protein [Pseudomonadota bacterium]
MIPRVPKSATGTSFKGLIAQYLLHDKDTMDTADRVLWTETRNLASDDPDVAWRLMAATHMDAKRLQAEHCTANGKDFHKGGQSFKNGLFHYSLAWSGEQEGNPGRDEMMRAANQSLRALGADHLQAMIIAHDAETNPHVHIVVGRTNPDTGYCEAIDGNAWSKLSEFALKYEVDRGQVLCQARFDNAKARERGQFYEQHQPDSRKQWAAKKHAAETIKAAPGEAKTVSDRERAQDRFLGAATREMRARHREEWASLTAKHALNKAEINRTADADKRTARRAVQDQWKSKLADFDKQRIQEQTDFAQKENTLRGTIGNVAGALKNVWNTRDTAGKGTVSRAFGVMGNSGARMKALLDAQKKAEAKLLRDQKKAIKVAQGRVEDRRKQAIHTAYQNLVTGRSSLTMAQAMDKAANKAAWRKRDFDRDEAWQKFDAHIRLTHGFKAAAANEVGRAAKRTEDDRKAKPSRTRTEQRGAAEGKSPTRPKRTRNRSKDRKPRAPRNRNKDRE